MKHKIKNTPRFLHTQNTSTCNNEKKRFKYKLQKKQTKLNRKIITKLTNSLVPSK